MDSNVCPLLKDPEGYNPDTVDLINDEAERGYWLPCLLNLVRKFVQKAGPLNPDDPNATAKAEVCAKKFQELVDKARDDPMVMSPLSIRTLLEFQEDNLRANQLNDAWLFQKESEGKTALAEFEDRIKVIDGLQDFHKRWSEIVTGVLAGNVFDWGSRDVQDILETSVTFGLNEAMETIEKRPWFKDDLDNFIRRINVAPYKKVVIFVDNAGFDLILGILPLVREFLKQNTRVILTANSSPALNDVTFDELQIYCKLAAQYCPVLEKALASGHLITTENGQKGPCLDLTKLAPDLCQMMSTADLVMLEGMGRAVHTNLHAKFKVDSVKLAVLKNEWLAKSLGAKGKFSVIFGYEFQQQQN